MASNIQNVVIDTNVIVSAFLSSHDDVATVLVLNKLYKNEIRFQIREEKREVINSSKGKGIINPRLGSMDYETYDILEKLDEDKDLTMQNLYDAIDEVEGFEYKSVINKGNEIYVVFENGDSTIEKHFDGSNSFVD